MQAATIAALAVLLIAVQIEQPFPDVAPLHHIPTALVILAAPFVLRRWPLSNAAVLCIAVFLALHTIGGRYTYSNLPYDQWSEAMLGRSIGDMFGWSRNVYDRFVHFAYGVLAVRPAWEVLHRYGGIGWRPALLLALAGITALSAIYEIVEWLLTLFLAGPLADDYNGQQGDAWDAQKDMSLALGGAVIGAALLRFRVYRPNSAAGSSGRVASG